MRQHYSEEFQWIDAESSFWKDFVKFFSSKSPPDLFVGLGTEAERVAALVAYSAFQPRPIDNDINNHHSSAERERHTSSEAQNDGQPSDLLNVPRYSDAPHSASAQPLRDETAGDEDNRIFHRLKESCCNPSTQT